MRWVVPAILLLTVPAAAQPYDILIRHARVLDGAGNPWFRASVGIRDGLIVRIGLIPSQAEAIRTIDANDRFLAPGFIDIHTHVEGNLEASPAAENFLRDGVTTVVTGNCGGSRPDLAAWFAELERLRPGVNVASLTGHNTIRRAVMGNENRPATPDELGRMQALVEREMRAGAAGLSTGLEYTPGAYAPPSEITQLAKVAASFGGIYASHMRNEGAQVLDAMNEALAIGREAGIRVEISHLKQDTKRSWGSAPKMLALLEQARAEGIDAVADQYPYDRSATSLSIRLPSWALAGTAEDVRKRLTTPSTRAEIAAEMKRMLDAKGHEDFAYAMVAGYPPDRSYEGKTIPEITRLRGRDATLDQQIETIFDMMLAGGASMVYHVMSEEDIETILRWPHTAIASDGGVRTIGEGMPHPRSYGTNARILNLYVRQRGVLGLEDAIRRMTSLPARTLMLHDRGLVREGAVADLVLFDLNAVRDPSSFTNPHKYSEGFNTVIVNGRIAIDEGRLSAERHGQPVRRQVQ